MINRLLGLLLGLLPLLGQAQAEDPICKDPQQLQRLERQLQRPAPRSGAYPQPYGVDYHRLEWDIDPARYYIQGRVTTYFRAATAAFQTLAFDLSRQLSVSRVTYHGTAIAFTQTAGDLLVITLPTALALGRRDSVSIDYAGQPADTGFGSFIQTTHAGVPVLWTLSEPYGAKDWWPCKQTLDDKIDSIDIIVRTPKAYRAAANGSLIGEWTSGEQKVYHWRHRYPITAYLVAIAVTNYTVYRETANVNGRPLLVENYVYPEALSTAQAGTPSCLKTLELFSRLFGDYPFLREKYGHAQFGWGGGMEHQTMSFVVNFSHSLLAHELAHQWFGDQVTCGSWRDIWLNEGFATFCEGLTYQYGLGSITWRNWVSGKLSQVVSTTGGSVYVKDTTSVNAIFNSRLSYSKGALVLNMLRWRLGEAAFLTSLRQYLQDPAVRYGYARTADLQRHAEQNSGQNLEQFFAQWIYGEGYPSYQVEWNPPSSSGQPGALKLSQTTSHPSVAFFAMPVPVQLKGAGRDTLLVLDHRYSGQVFTLPALSFQATELVFDPDLQLISARNRVLRNNTLTAVDDARLAPVVLYPNPTRATLTLELPSAVALTGPIQIFDAAGRRSAVLPPHPVVDLRALPAGAYWLVVPTTVGWLRRRVLKVG